MPSPGKEWVGQQLAACIKGSADSIKGEVYTYDKDSDTLVIKDQAVGLQEANYRFLKGKDTLWLRQQRGRHGAPMLRCVCFRPLSRQSRGLLLPLCAQEK